MEPGPSAFRPKLSVNTGDDRGASSPNRRGNLGDEFFLPRLEAAPTRSPGVAPMLPPSMRRITAPQLERSNADPHKYNPLSNLGSDAERSSANYKAPLMPPPGPMDADRVSLPARRQAAADAARFADQSVFNPTRRSVTLQDLDYSIQKLGPQRNPRLGTGAETLGFKRGPVDTKVGGGAGLTQFDSIVGYQGDFLDLFDSPSPSGGKPLPHAISRKTLLLKVPIITDVFSVDVPALVEDRQGHACLIVLPSDKPSTRSEALAVEALLVQMLKDPLNAAQKAALWRAQVLSTMCTDALSSMSDSMHGDRMGPRPLGQSWKLKTAKAESDTTKARKPFYLQAGEGSPEAEVPISLAGLDTGGAANVTDLLASAASESNLYPGTSGSAPNPNEGPVVRSSGSNMRGESETGDTNDLLVNKQLLETINVTVAATICMADIIRQVEVHCGERGRVLTYVWNAYLSTHENTMSGLKKENTRLVSDYRRLSSQINDLSTAVQEAAYLRKETARFRSQIAVSDAEVDKLLTHNLFMTSSMEDALKAMKGIEAFLDKTLARLRWGHAFHIVGTRSQRFVLITGGLGKKGEPATVVRKVVMLERLLKSVMDTERRKKALGRMVNAEDYHKATHFSDVVTAALADSTQSRWNIGKESLSMDETLEALKSLHPEAATIVLGSMSEERRWEVLKAMDSTQRAKMVVVMSEEMRDLTKAALGVDSWKDTMDAVAASTDLAVSFLRNFPPWEAMMEFQRWSLDRQSAVLVVLDKTEDHSMVANTILGRMPSEMREPLTARVGMDVMTRYLETFNPDALVDFFESLSLEQQKSILASMDRAKAAAYLSYCGVETTVNIMVEIGDEDTCQEILVWMAPKVAAKVVIRLQEISVKKAAEEAAAAMDVAPAAVSAEAERAASGEAGSKEGEGTNQEATTNTTAADANDAASHKATADAGTANASSQTNAAAEQMEGAKARATSAPTHQEGGMGGRVLSVMASEAAEIIMGYMNFKDRADMMALLDPAKVAEILALMDAKDAVMLLASMSDASMEVISMELTEENRERLVATLHEASARAGGKSSGVKAGGGKKGYTGMGSVSREGGMKSMGGSVTLNESKKEKVNAAYELATAKCLIMDSDEELDEEDGGGGMMLRRNSEDIVVVEKDERGSGRDEGKKGGPQGVRSRRSGDVMKPAAKGISMSRSQSAVGSVSKSSPRRTDITELQEIQELVVEEEGDEGAEIFGDHEEEADSKQEEVEGEEETAEGQEGANPRAGGGKSKGKGKLPRAVSRRSTVPNRIHPQEDAKISSDAPKNVKKALKAAIKAKPDGQDMMKAAVEHVFHVAKTEQEGKLGKLPKNQRLKDAMAQHSGAKPKPKGWLMSVVEQIYKDAGALINKMGRAEVIRKQSVAEIVFTYFFNKYGQKNVVNEYVGALVNTLTLYKLQDLRLEAFAKFLSEEWEFLAFLDFMQASALMSQPQNVLCIEFSKDPEKGEQYTWVDYTKAVHIADLILGHCSNAVRERFFESLTAAAVQTPDADVIKFTAQAKKMDGQSRPEQFFRLPRIRFLMILTKESERINALIQKLADDRFTKQDQMNSGVITVKAVHDTVISLLPSSVDPAIVHDAHRQILTLSEAQTKDMNADHVAVDSVEEVGKKFYISSVLQCGPIRDHIKANLLQPARPEDNTDDSEIYKTYLTSVIMRHTTALMPYFTSWLRAAGKEAAIQDRLTEVYKEVTGDGKFKAYLNLLVAVLNLQVQGVLNEIVGPDMDPENMNSDMVEREVGRLEDMVIVLLHNDSYLLATDASLSSQRIARLPPASRMRFVMKDCKAHKAFQSTIESSAAYVFQQVWRERKLRRMRMLDSNLGT